MSQATAAIPNMARTLFRAAVNAITQAIQSQNSGLSEPSETYPYMWWADTTTGLMKQRNAADNGWVIVANLANWAIASVQSQTATAFTTAGTSTAYTLTTVPAAAALAENQRYQVEWHTTSGAAATLTRDGLAAKDIKIYTSDGSKAAPGAGVLVAGVKSDVVYDGTDFVVLSPLPAASRLMAQEQSSYSGAYASGTTLIPFDDTIPQITEGDQYLSVAITPKNAASDLVIEVTFCGTHSANTNLTVALFQSGVSSALAAVDQNSPGGMIVFSFKHKVAAGSTTARTYSVRAGGHNAGTTYFNGAGGTRYLGGAMASSIVVKEVLP